MPIDLIYSFLTTYLIYSPLNTNFLHRSLTFGRIEIDAFHFKQKYFPL